MAIVLAKQPAKAATGTDTKVVPPFFPCCVCPALLDWANPVHICHKCRRGHCEGCGAFMDDGSRRCTICLAGAGCHPTQHLAVVPARQSAAADPIAQETRPYGRGSWATVNQITQDPTSIKAARREFDEAVYACSSRRSNASRARTWQRTCHLLGIQDNILTPESIFAVMSVLRQAGYRSAKLILSQTKSDFVRGGGGWTAQLDQAAREANRAADRDIGPAQQSCPFPVEMLPSLPRGPDPRIEGGPCYPQRVDTICCFFALRGAEVRAARAHNVTRTSRGTTMTLSKTKTDPSALGTSRTHQCACPASRGDAAVVHPAACPACATWAQARWALDTFGDSPATPLFLSTTGGQISSHAFLKHLEAAFAALRLPIRGHGGAKTVGEHSCRNGIAVYLASRGVPVWQIQGLLRHSNKGQTVLRYIREAHVHASTNLAEEAELGRDLDAIRRKIAAVSSEAKTIESAVKATLKRSLEDGAKITCPPVILSQEDIMEMEDDARNDLPAIEDMPSANSPGGAVGPPTEARPDAEEVVYVVSTQPGGRGVTHILNLKEPTRTKCGWHFLRTRWHTLTNNPLCDPPLSGESDPPPGGCRPICKLCLG